MKSGADVQLKSSSWSAGNRKALVGVKVLVVDDSPDVLLLVGAVLRRYGAEVVVASSAAEGLRMLEAENPDVLLSDISMPDEDGIVLIQNVRSFEARKGRGQTPAAALTAHAHSEVRSEMLKAGFQLHLPKPIEARALVKAVAGLAGRMAIDQGCT